MGFVARYSWPLVPPSHAHKNLARAILHVGEEESRKKAGRLT